MLDHGHRVHDAVQCSLKYRRHQLGVDATGTYASRHTVCGVALTLSLVDLCEFHDTDADILADTSDTRDFLKLFLWQAERNADILAMMSVSASWNGSFRAQTDDAQRSHNEYRSFHDRLLLADCSDGSSILIKGKADLESGRCMRRKRAHSRGLDVATASSTGRISEVIPR